MTEEGRGGFYFIKIFCTSDKTVCIANKGNFGAPATDMHILYCFLVIRNKRINAFVVGKVE